MCDLLSSRRNVWGEIRLVASARSAGRSIVVRGEPHTVLELAPEVFDGVDVAMFDVPDDVSAEWAPIAAARGAVVVDNSGAFRMDPQVPLVVPEVNPDRGPQPPARDHRQPELHDARDGGRAGRAARASTTCASWSSPRTRPRPGPGRPAWTRCWTRSTKVAGDRMLGSRSGNLRQAIGDDLGPFPAPLALNVVPWAGSLRDAGWSSEELKIRNETRKILGLPDLKVSATCVRVPVVTGHSLAVHAVFRSDVDADGAREVLQDAPGVIVVDDPSAGEFPMPADAVGTDPTWVGRIRRSLDDPRALDFFVTGDNLRKGAALNTAQIAELVAASL